MKLNEIIDLLNSAKISAVNLNSLKDLEDFRVKYLSRNGLINTFLKEIKFLSLEEKKKHGNILNEFKNFFTFFLNKKKEELSKNKRYDDLDLTLPGLGFKFGSFHLINKTIKEIEKYFFHFGFNIVNGIEIDTVFYNFDALNIQLDHPSRSEKDTFYINNDLLLRTHTSNMQIHVMKKFKPPLKVLSYGKVYRRDYDLTHTPMFHQIEGFVVDKNISLANLKFLLTNFLNYFFDKNIKSRIRPSYFPFTDPSLEIDIECIKCFGKKCSVCKFSGWIEVLGCGIIHKKVLSNSNYGSSFSGLAFGMGVERLTMIKYCIDDLRMFFDNNIEFLSQFR